eukprot:g9961.t1
MLYETIGDTQKTGDLLGINRQISRSKKKRKIKLKKAKQKKPVKKLNKKVLPSANNVEATTVSNAGPVEQESFKNLKNNGFSTRNSKDLFQSSREKISGDIGQNEADELKYRLSPGIVTQRKNLRPAPLVDKVEDEAEREAEDEAKREAEDEAKREAGEEAKRKAEEEAKRKAEEEAKRKAEEEAKRKAEEEAKRKAEEEAKRKAEEEAKRKAEEEEAKRKAEEEAKRLASRLREIGLCPQSFKWRHISNAHTQCQKCGKSFSSGYRCEGGSHYVCEDCVNYN